MMSIPKKAGLLFSLFIIPLFVFCGRVSAADKLLARSSLSDNELNIYSQNNIMFYDPTECVSAVKGGGNCGAEITGETMEERIRQIVSQYGIYMMNMQIEYGIPWESQFVNMLSESHIGTDGPGSISYSAEKCGYMNWHGYTYASNALYGHSLSEPGICVLAHGDGAGNSPLYDNLLDEITAYGPDFLRNGAYDRAFEYASPESFNLEAFMRTAYDGTYCAVGCWGHVYGSVFRRVVPVVQAIAKENGWPTSEELMRQYNIPKGGNWSDKWGNIKKYIDAEPHSLHAVCGVSVTTLGDVSDISLRDGAPATVAASVSSGSASDSSSGESYGTNGITLIGDSISVQSESELESKFPGSFLNMVGSRSPNGAGDGCSNDSGGIEVLRRLVSGAGSVVKQHSNRTCETISIDSSSLKNTVVWALGTNQIGAEEVLDEVISLVGSRKLYLVTPYNGSSMTRTNEIAQAYRDIAADHDNVYVVDWNKEIQDNAATYVGSDGVHPTVEGKKTFAKLIYDAISSNGGSGDGCNVSVSGAGEAIAQTAVKMAWPEGTSSSKWYHNSGVPEEFTAMAEKWGFDGYPSCSRFASMVILESGVDPDFESILRPKGSRKNNLYTLESYLANSPNWTEVSYEESQRGDIIINHEHVEVYIGNDKKAHAAEVGSSSPTDNNGPHIDPLSERDKHGDYKWYRSTNTDTSINVSGSGAGCGLCSDSGSSTSSGTGEVDPVNGLTFEQAKVFMMHYGENKNDSSKKPVQFGGGSAWNNSSCYGDGGSNCVAFSAFFIHKFTDSLRNTGSGHETVKNMTNVDGKDQEPKVWAVFSGYRYSSTGRLMPHTGVILGHYDGEWIVGHASCHDNGRGAGTGGDGTFSGRGSGVGFVIKSSDLRTAILGYNLSTPGFAYPKNVDISAIEEYLRTGE